MLKLHRLLLVAATSVCFTQSASAWWCHQGHYHYRASGPVTTGGGGGTGFGFVPFVPVAPGGGGTGFVPIGGTGYSTGGVGFGFVPLVPAAPGTGGTGGTGGPGGIGANSPFPAPITPTPAATPNCSDQIRQLLADRFPTPNPEIAQLRQRLDDLEAKVKRIETKLGEFEETLKQMPTNKQLDEKLDAQTKKILKALGKE